MVDYTQNQSELLLRKQLDAVVNFIDHYMELRVHRQAGADIQHFLLDAFDSDIVINVIE